MIEQAERAKVAGQIVPEPAGQAFAMAHPSTSRPKSLRRFLRFNLLTALILFLLLSAYFGMRQRFAVSREELSAKRSLAEIGGRFVTHPIEPAWLRNGLMLHDERYQYVDEVTFAPERPEWGFVGEDGSLLQKKRLEALTAIPRLRSIDFWNKSIDDDALAYVARCANLQLIVWNWASINDAGVEQLRSLRKLQSIDLQRTFTTDRSLEILADSPELTSIALDDATTARGIEALLSYPKLKHVDARATSLRAEDVQPLVDHGVAVMLPTPNKTTDDDAENPIVYSWVHAAGSSSGSVVKPLRIDVSPRTRIDESFLKAVDSRFESLDLHFIGFQRVPDETIAMAVRDQRVVSIELPPCGFPYREEEVREFLTSRSTDAPTCRVYGHVLTSGSELLEAAQKNSGSRPYVAYDVPSSLLEPLKAVGVWFERDRIAPGIRFWDRNEGLTVPVEPDA